MKTFASVALAGLIAFSAASQDPAEKSKPARPESQPVAGKDRKMGLATPIVMAKDREVYGAEITLKENTKLSDVLSDPKTYVGKKIRVTAVIQGVCQKKGCWMVVKDGDAQAQVKFHDYSFFVPLDVTGRMVVVEGTAKETVVTEAWRRHYAEDAGKSKEEIAKIKGDEKTVMLIVEAVEIGAAATKDDAKAAESKPAEKKSS